jgi:hypothetical protein
MRIAGSAVFQAMEIADKFEGSRNSQKRGNQENDSAVPAPTHTTGDAAKPDTGAVRLKNLVPAATLAGPSEFLPARTTGLIDEIV